MLKYGIISEVDAPKGRARVNFQEDEIVSDWLPISVPGSLGNRYEFWPEVNMHVWCIMDDNSENGVIGGALYDDGNTPEVGDVNKSVVKFKDGTTVTYDTDASTLVIECVGDVTIQCVNATIEASEKVTIDTPTAEFTGDIEVTGGINANGDIETSGGINATGEVHSDLQVSAGVGLAAVHLSTHIHTTPSGPSSAPTPGT
jgi:phage baseplate assembly protein V